MNGKLFQESNPSVKEHHQNTLTSKRQSEEREVIDLTGESDVEGGDKASSSPDIGSRKTSKASISSSSKQQESKKRKILPEPLMDSTEMSTMLNPILTVTRVNRFGTRGISFPQLIPSPRSEIRAIFVSAFCIDPDWLFPHFQDIPSFAPIIIASRKPATLPANQNSTMDTRGNLWVFPHMPSKFGCMHTKLLIFATKTMCRVVVTSANFVDYDWSVLENAVFVQDFPHYSQSKQGASKISASTNDRQQVIDLTRHEDGAPPSPCGTRLGQILENLSAPAEFREVLGRYDFSAACFQWVESIPGNFAIQSTRDPKPKYGQESLKQGLIDLGISIPNLRLDYQTGTVGSLTWDWLHKFYLNCSPLQTNSAMATIDTIKHRIRILFPSLLYIKASLDGPNCAGSIIFNSRFNTLSFPRSVLHNPIRRRNGVLAHSKVLVGYDKCVKDIYNPSSPTPESAFMYLGSHNFTAAAWGREMKGRAGNATKISINNYELGIVFKLQDIPGWREGVGLEGSGSQPYALNDIPWCVNDYHMDLY